MSQTGSTLDVEHTNELARQARERAAADAKEAEIERQDARLAELAARGPRMSDEELAELHERSERRTELARSLAESRARSDEVDYLLRTADIMFRYYDIIEKHGGSGTCAAAPGVAPGGRPSILSFFPGGGARGAASDDGAVGGGPLQADDRATLLDRVWGYGWAGDTRLVDVHVQRLRAKIEVDPASPELVQTVRGVGYKLVRPSEDP